MMETEAAQIASVIVSSVLTGIVSTIGTVKALNVHISYLREQQAETKKAVERAHERLDEHIREYHSNTGHKP